MPDVDLVLLASTFPFQPAAEPFLETELPIIAPYFRKIYLLPSDRASGVASAIPPNAEVIEMPWLAGYDRKERRRALTSAAALRVLRWSIRTWRDLIGYAPASKLYADILAQNVLKARDLSEFVRSHNLSGAIFYDYWFENSTLALSLLRSQNVVSTAVARAHRFDIYDDAWGGRPVPFREAKARGLDAVFAVSDSGAAYLDRMVPAIAGKLRLSRLGAIDLGLTSPEPQAGAAPLIVTCAQLIPRKRIHLVPQVLSELETPVRWVHIGDGPERGRVAAGAEGVLAPDSWEMLGDLANQDVLRFYSTNSVQALLSLSESEGIPVSMMEAQGLGIPVVSCDVGGISEIVSAKSGVLVSVDASAAEMAAAVRRTIGAADLTREAVRAEFLSRYDAEANYRGFVDDILALQARASALA